MFHDVHDSNWTMSSSESLCKNINQTVGYLSNCNDFSLTQWTESQIQSVDLQQEAI